ncbi:hypothetical protein T12_14760 [Trichinella patagoniensis]|uniref:Uncharacterized protein n=1 Tax=Trichinella patagoniensis TaxID=990121 RepID=A0A0V0Z8I3_9BILA|nr:hypothetical protein T12_14760 [Trichinella patagoniensis]
MELNHGMFILNSSLTAVDVTGTSTDSGANVTAHRNGARNQFEFFEQNTRPCPRGNLRGNENLHISLKANIVQ